MILVVVEGPSAAGKTSYCRRFAGPEVVPPRRPGGIGATWTRGMGSPLSTT